MPVVQPFSCSRVHNDAILHLAMTKSHAATVCVCGGVRLWELVPPRLEILPDDLDVSKTHDMTAEITRGLGLIAGEGDAVQGQECRGAVAALDNGGEGAEVKAAEGSKA